MAAGMIGLPLAGCSTWLAAPGRAEHQVIASAVRFANGDDGVAAFDTGGRMLWRRRLPARCHGGAVSPDGRLLVLFERRPGWRAHVMELATGRLRGELPLAEQEHFYGHGVFSPAGDRLYATVNDYANGRGLVAVYHHSDRGWQRADTFDLAGIGPHQIVLNPVDDTLAVALGGIDTHPDYPRLKRNLDTMDPALMILDRRTGQALARHRPSHHQLSCRHIAVTPEGAVWAGYQYQGPAHHRPPLMARLGSRRFEEFRLPVGIDGQVDNYIASVAACPATGLVAMTAPRGGVVVVVDGRSGRHVGTTAVVDGSGVTAAPGGGFLISTGQGQVLALQPGGTPSKLLTPDVRWDNHLIA
jgi:hypothetical protein